MTTNKLLTPCGAVSVLKNSIPIPFDVADSQCNSMWIDDGTGDKKLLSIRMAASRSQLIRNVLPSAIKLSVRWIRIL